MGMTVVLFRVGACHFERIKVTSQYQTVLEVATDSLGLDKTFHGLEYLLTKAGVDASTASEIINPATSLDEAAAADVGDLDFDTASEEELLALYDHYSNAICYTAPAEVLAKWTLLRAISPEQIGAQFSSVEMNERGIYPENWHDQEGPQYAFNRPDMMREYRDLQRFYQQASEAGEYIFTLGSAS